MQANNSKVSFAVDEGTMPSTDTVSRDDSTSDKAASSWFANWTLLNCIPSMPSPRSVAMMLIATGVVGVGVGFALPSTAVTVAGAAVTALGAALLFGRGFFAATATKVHSVDNKVVAKEPLSAAAFV